MIAHKLIDALLGRGGKLMEPRETWRPKAEREAMAAAILRAQKFDFGNLMLERASLTERGGLSSGESAEDFDAKYGGRFKIPELSADEAEFFKERLVPLPFKSVWYEFTIGETPSAMLIEEISDGVWQTQRLEYDATICEVLYDGMKVDVHLSQPYMSERWAKVHGNPMLMQILGIKEFRDLNYGANAPLAYYLTLMLSSRTTQRMPGFTSPPKVAAAQRRKGRTPMPAHTVVRIVPEQYQKDSAAEGARTHSPPRLHWRRSHLRHYDHQVPSAKFAAGIMHAGKTGWWCTVIPRMLVGRADLGEVSHEYKIKGGTHDTATA